MSEEELEEHIQEETKSQEPELLLDDDTSYYDKSKEYHDTNIKVEIIKRIFQPTIYLFLAIVGFPQFIIRIANLSPNYNTTTISVVIVSVATISWVLMFPLSVYSEKVERRFAFATRTTRRWIRDQILIFLLSLILSLVIFGGLYFLLDNYERLWWFYGFLGYFIIFSVLMTILPILLIPLFMRIEPLEVGEVRQAVENLARSMELEYKDIYLGKMSQITTKANAFVSGFGKTIRIVLGDTLIDQFRIDEIEVVMAHEIAHQQKKHIYKGMIYGGIVTLVILAIMDIILDDTAKWFNYTSKSDPASIAFFFFLFQILSEFTSIFNLAMSRYHEKEADVIAIHQTKNIDAYSSAFRRLAKTGLSYPNPSKIEVWLRYSHPPIRDRLKYGKEIFDKI